MSERVARRHDAIGEDLAPRPCSQSIDDVVERAAAARSSPPAMPNRLSTAAPSPRGACEREPLAHQLRRRIGPARRRPSVLGVGFGVAAVEDEVGAVVHERGAGLLGAQREAAHREGVDRQRLYGWVSGAIHVVERRAVDDDVGTPSPATAWLGTRIGDVERALVERHHLAIGKGADDEVGRAAVAPASTGRDSFDESEVDSASRRSIVPSGNRTANPETDGNRSIPR